MSTEDKKTDNESNKLIAEFMGLERTRGIWDNGEQAYTIKISGDYFNRWTIPSEMLYAIDWNWIMSVVQKIKTLAVTSKLPYEPFKIVTHTTVNADISTLYKRIVEFIKWYNDQNPK